MKVKRVAYKVDEFVDFKGNTRKFIMTAVSIIPEFKGQYAVEVCPSDYDCEYQDITKILSIGVSVCRPDDNFDQDLGIEIATGKAIKNEDHRIYSSDKGLINNHMVMALLEQECQYFKSNPGRYLKGYDQDKYKYLKELDMIKMRESLSEQGKAVAEYIENGDDVPKTIDYICQKLGLI